MKSLKLTKKQIEIREIAEGVFRELMEKVDSMNIQRILRIEAKVENMGKDIIEHSAFARTLNSTFEGVLKGLIQKNENTAK